METVGLLCCFSVGLVYNRNYNLTAEPIKPCNHARCGLISNERYIFSVI